MRFLGIDYGTKRIGIALSDAGGQMAFPHATYENDAHLLPRLAELCAKERVGTIVVGESRTLSGTPNPIQKDIGAFVARLRDTVSVPVVLTPEQFSTQAALRLQGRTEKTDASAAALILDSYLARRPAL